MMRSTLRASLKKALIENILAKSFFIIKITIVLDPYKIKKLNFNKDVIINKISDIYNVLKVYNTDTEWGVLDGFSGIIFFFSGLL